MQGTLENAPAFEGKDKNKKVIPWGTSDILIEEVTALEAIRLAVNDRIKKIVGQA